MALEQFENSNSGSLDDDAEMTEVMFPFCDSASTDSKDAKEQDLPHGDHYVDNLLRNLADTCRAARLDDQTVLITLLDSDSWYHVRATNRQFSNGKLVVGTCDCSSGSHFRSFVMSCDLHTREYNDFVRELSEIDSSYPCKHVSAALLVVKRLQRDLQTVLPLSAEQLIVLSKNPATVSVPAGEGDRAVVAVGLQGRLRCLFTVLQSAL